MASIPFIIQRLRAMSLSEVVHRINKELQDRAEYRRLDSIHGESKIDFMKRHQLILSEDEFEIKQALLYQELLRRKPLPWQNLPSETVFDAFAGRLKSNRDATLSAADQLRNNRFKIFDRELFFHDEIQWNMDPLSCNHLPAEYWSRVDYRNSRIVKEIKYIWELNRLQHFVTLGKAFYLSGNEQYADALAAQWQDWIKKNPYLIGVGWTSALECAFRLVSWVWALQLAKNSSAVTPEFVLDVLISVEQHGTYIERHLSRFSSANNHLVGEALGLIYAGCYFPVLSQALRWQKNGFDLLQTEIIKQVHPDGVAMEQSSHYQRYLMDFCSLALAAAKGHEVSFNPEFLDRLQHMIDFASTLVDSNGHVPQIGDDDGGQAIRLSEDHDGRFLDSIAVLQFYLDNSQKQAARGTESVFWLTGTQPQEQEADDLPKSDRSIRFFYEGGYVVFRGPVRGHFHHLILDVGLQGLGPMAAHGHADALNLLLHVNGHPVLIDCGTWLYLGAGQQRDFFRGTLAHNTVVVDEENQADPVGPFQWGRKVEASVEEYIAEDNRFSVTACHNGYENKGIKHQRKIDLPNDGEWLITDRIEGSGVHSLDLLYHLSDCNFSNISTELVRCDFEWFTVDFQFEANREYQIVAIDSSKEILSWRSPSFGYKLRHPVLRITARAALPVEFKTKIIVR